MRAGASAPAARPTADANPLSASREASLLGVLVLCAVLPYVSTLLNDFLVTYDDGPQILRNPYVHSFRYLRQIFGTHVWSYLGANSITNYYRPVMTFGYLLCYKTFGPEAYGFHLVNLVLHAAIVSLLFGVTLGMTSDRLVAFAAAALFAIHPVHTEPVAWISAVPELEVTLFLLVTFWFYLELVRGEGKSSELVKLVMVVSYILALLSKEQALVLPPLAALFEHFFRPDRAKTTWSEKLSRYGVLWLVGFGYVLFRIHFLGGFAPLLQRPRFGWPETVVAAVALIGQYLWKLVWPANLLFYYVFPESLKPLIPWVLGGVVALIVCAVLVLRLWQRNPVASFGLAWMLVTLAPVLNVRWMARNVFAERYLYLPSVGFCWVVASAGAVLWRDYSRGAARARPLLVGAAGVIALLCFSRTVGRNRDWRDDVTLYERTLAVSPNAYPVREALGLAYWNRGNLEAAEQEWRKVLMAAPGNASTWNYLGALLAQRKQFSTAVRCFKQSLELEPASADAHLNLGAAYAEQNSMGLAEAEFRTAVSLSPLNIQAHNVLGKLYFDAGRPREAEAQFLESAEIEPNVAAFDHLGYIFGRSGDARRAEWAFLAALSVNASDSRAHFGLGAIYAASGRYSEAIREYQAGLKTEPDEPEALAALRKLSSQHSPQGPPIP